jgi:hypothetical protein
MYGPPYSTVSTSVGHYPHEALSTVLHVHTYQRHYNWADITQVRDPTDRPTTDTIVTGWACGRACVSLAGDLRSSTVQRVHEWLVCGQQHLDGEQQGRSDRHGPSRLAHNDPEAMRW